MRLSVACISNGRKNNCDAHKPLHHCYLLKSDVSLWALNLNEQKD
jgi:hypothetical protein